MTKPAGRTIRDSALSNVDRVAKESIKQRMWDLLHIAASVDANESRSDNGQDTFPQGYYQMVAKLHDVLFMSPGYSLREFSSELVNRFGSADPVCDVAIKTSMTASDLESFQDAISNSGMSPEAKADLFRRLGPNRYPRP